MMIPASINAMCTSCSGPKLLDRQVIDPHKHEPAVDQPPSGIGREGDEVGVKLVVIPEAAVPSLHEQAPSARGKAKRLEIGRRDMAVASMLDDVYRTEHRLDRKRLDGGAAVDEVVRCVDMGPAVGAERDLADVGRAVFTDALEVLEFRPGFAGIGRHAGPERHRDVVDGQLRPPRKQC